MTVKELIKANGVYQWEVAEKMNMSEFTLSRKLRRPENLDRGTVQKIENAVREVRSAKAQSGKE